MENVGVLRLGLERANLNSNMSKFTHKEKNGNKSSCSLPVLHETYVIHKRGNDVDKGAIDHQSSRMCLKSNSSPSLLPCAGKDERNDGKDRKPCNYLSDNSKLLKMTNELRKLQHKLNFRVSDLETQNKVLEEAIQKSEKEYQSLESKLISPEVYSNFEVAKMYENWAKVLQEELEENRNQNLEINRRLEDSSKKIEKLIRQRRNLEESLLFYKRILEYEHTIPKSVTIPTICFCMERGMNPEREAIDAKLVSREVCELITEENIILRKQKETADMKNKQFLDERDNLEVNLQQHCQINAALISQYNALIDDYNACYQNFQHLLHKLNETE